MEGKKGGEGKSVLIASRDRIGFWVFGLQGRKQKERRRRTARVPVRNDRKPK